MGSSDVPPPGTPDWVVPASTLLLGNGVLFWLISYNLMLPRSLSSGSTPVPMLALAINLSWELVFAFYVTDSLIERLGFTAWLLLDLPVLYASYRTAPRTFRKSGLLARYTVPIFLSMFLWGCWANWYFAAWWFEVEGRGSGDKTGKIWRGKDKRDSTELAWWTAGVAQMIMSVGSLAMLLQRGHSGGQSLGIWATRFIGTISGLPLCCALLWYYWPEAHGYVLQPLSFIILGTSLLCDLIYPLALIHAKKTEVILADGTVIAREEMEYFEAPSSRIKKDK